LLDVVTKAGRDTAAFSLEVRGDSQLVLKQVAGEWKVKEPELMPLCSTAKELLSRFGEVKLTWQERNKTEEVLGH